MSDDETEPIIIASLAGVAADDGTRARKRRDYTLVRCDCGREASVPTSTLPLELRPVRHDDGTRWALCPGCAPKPNRAARRSR